MQTLDTPTGQKTLPGPTDIIRLGVDESPLQLFSDLAKRYGQMFQFTTPMTRICVVADPAYAQEALSSQYTQRTTLLKMLLGDGLLTSSGAYWRQQRKSLQPAFATRRVASFIEPIAEEVNNLALQWAEAASSNLTVNVSQDMTKLTLRVICRIVFSENIQPTTADSLQIAIDECIKGFGELSLVTFGIPVSFAPTHNKAFQAHRAIIDDFFTAQIQRRRLMYDGPDDVLNVLLSAQFNGQPLSERQICDELMTLFVAGHETTAVALSWMWKLLGENETARESLQTELSDVLGTDAITPTNLDTLAWTRGCFLEALRLYPPVWVIFRSVQDNFSLGQYEIPRHACLAVPPWLIHRDQSLWSEAKRFQPGRFVQHKQGHVSKNAFIPFGAGHHQCIGLSFATQEGTVTLAELARRFVVTPINASLVEPLAWITLRQKPSLRANIEFRDK